MIPATEHEFIDEKIITGEIQLFRTLWNNSKDSMFVVRLANDGTYISEKSNPTQKKISKTVDEEIDNLPLSKILDTKVYEKIAKRYDECINKNIPITYEESHIIEGENKYFTTTILPVIDTTNNLTRIFGISRDITAIKNAEKTMNEYNENLKKSVIKSENEQKILLSLFDKGDSTLFQWNNDALWSVSYVSKNILKLLGYSQDEFLNGNINYIDCIHKEDLPIVLEEVKKATKSDENYFQHKPYRLVTKENECKWVIDYTVIIRDENEQITHFVGYITNITQAKNNEKLLAEQAKLVAMGEMIGNIAHQWRQPLSVISTKVTGLKLQKSLGILEDKVLINAFDSINDNVQYLSQTIDDFQNFVRGDTCLVSFDLKNDTDSFIKLVDSTIQNYNINVVLDLKEDIRIKGFPNELIQCFINIFNNSKDAFLEKEVDEDSRYIFISQDIYNDEVIITFKDNAGGIDENIINRIFEPYFTTKHKSQGTGLGLHMTYNLIVEGMKGRITAQNKTYLYENREFKGVEFQIILPIL